MREKRDDGCILGGSMTMRKTRKRKPLKAGTRVRLKTRTVDGWKGTGTLLRDFLDGDDLVKFIPDDDKTTTVMACRHEVAVLRDQTPPSLREHKSVGRE